MNIPELQEKFDDAMFDFSMADYDAAIAKLRALLELSPDHFDAQLALGMAYYRKGDYDTAIVEGHKAERLEPKEQLVHTNLSLFYMKSGDKQTAEHHGLQARIAGWRETNPATAASSGDPELNMAQPAPAPMKFTGRVPDMPWKQQKPAAPADPTPVTNPDATSEKTEDKPS